MGGSGAILTTEAYWGHFVVVLLYVGITFNVLGLTACAFSLAYKYMIN